MPIFRLSIPLLVAVALSACGGGSSQKTAPKEEATTVASQRASFRVDAATSLGGSAKPAQQQVEQGTQALVSLVADEGYQLASVSGCDGQLTGSDYLTGPVRLDCEIRAVFEPLKGGVAGRLMPAPDTAVDYTLNDKQAALGVNTSCATAQPLSNRITLHGFASASASKGDSDQEHFASSGNPQDFYRVTLNAGQVVELENADAADLRLILWNKDCSQVLESSEADSSVGRVTSLSGGESVIEVRAQAGISKYLLRVTTAWESGYSSDDLEALVDRLPEFIPGEAIVSLAPGAGKQPHGKLSAAMENAQGLRMKFQHENPGRATLARFDALPGAAKPSGQLPALDKLRSAGKNKAYERLSTLRTIDLLARQPGVRSAEPNYVIRSQRLPNDAYYADQWHYQQIQLPEAWDTTVGESVNGRDVVVAVVDSGVYLDHEDLQGKLLPGWDFHDRDSDPDDHNDQQSDSWHGTHVAGSVAASTDNYRGVAGSAWGAKIMPVRVLGDEGGSRYDIIQGIRYAAGLPNDSGQLPERPADIINLSLGGGGYSAAEQALYHEILDAGIHLVAAAGNDNSNQPMYPAAYAGVLSVSATNCATGRASYSNYGPTISLAAPGGDKGSCGYFRTGAVVSTVGDGSGIARSSSYGARAGTSMAAPHVSGVLALMRAVYPDLSPAQVQTLLSEGSMTDDLGTAGRDEAFGFGLINARKAVEAARELGRQNAQWPARVTADPGTLSLGYQSQARIELSQQGEGQVPAVIAASGSAEWLQVSAEATDAQGLGSYQIAIDRSAFSESQDGHHQAEVVFTLEDDSLVRVGVHIQVGFASDAAPVYVLLLDAETRETRYETLARWTTTGELAYQIERVAAGDYVLVAGSDIDRNGLTCQLGESCGGYPDYVAPKVITVADGRLVGMDIPIDVLGRLGSFGGEASSGVSLR